MLALFLILSGLFCDIRLCCQAAERKNIMKDNLKKIGTRVYLYEKDALIKAEGLLTTEKSPDTTPMNENRLM